jgi:hypothetical protein
VIANNLHVTLAACIVEPSAVSNCEQRSISAVRKNLGAVSAALPLDETIDYWSAQGALWVHLKQLRERQGL